MPVQHSPRIARLALCGSQSTQRAPEGIPGLSMLFGAAFASFLSHSELAEDDLGRTKTCKCRLQQVRSDKSGQPEPVRIYPGRQSQADEDECAGKNSNCAFK